MWNPFSRQVDDEVGAGSTATRVAAAAPIEVIEPNEAPESPPPDEPSDGRYHEIGEIDMMGSIAIVTLTVEELCQEHGAVALADLLHRVVESGAQHMVLDIQNVQYMDSACIGCMVEALNRLAHSGGRIALANPHSSVANLFRITRLDRVFPICSDVLAGMNLIERDLQR